LLPILFIFLVIWLFWKFGGLAHIGLLRHWPWLHRDADKTCWKPAYAKCMLFDGINHLLWKIYCFTNCVSWQFIILFFSTRNINNPFMFNFFFK
jgi:hypothetical protein